MNDTPISKRLIELRDADVALRDQLLREGRLNDGYDTEMEQRHILNAMKLDDIIESIGYPTPAIVGQEAFEAAWLVTQHAISLPDFMRKCAKMLAKAVSEGHVKPYYLAYLTDRIAVLEGNVQLYGTQFDWDDDGILSPNPVDDVNAVNERRASMSLGTLEEQTDAIRLRAKLEHQKPPSNLKQRRIEMDAWRIARNWING